MDALLGTFLAVLLAAIGDRGQLLAILLTLRFPGRGRRVIAAAAVTGIVVGTIGAVTGAAVRGLVPFRALTLLAALALLSAGIGALARPKTPKLRVSPRLGAFGGSLAALLAAEIGGTAQFLTFALAARSTMPALAATGAALAIVTACVPAVLLGRTLVQAVPMRTARLAAAAILIPLGLWFGLGALRLT